MPRFEIGFTPPSVYINYSVAPLPFLFPYEWPYSSHYQIPTRPYEQQFKRTELAPNVLENASSSSITVPIKRSEVAQLPLFPDAPKPQVEEQLGKNSTAYNSTPMKANKIHPKNIKPTSEPKDPFLNANYKYRNVFKAIIRRMHSCVRKERTGLISTIQDAKYSLPEIERAFNRIAYYKNAERKSGKKRMSVRTIKEATEERSVYTYILKAALKDMLQDWKKGKLGRLTEKNVQTYVEVCTTYSERIERLLSNENTK